MIFNDVEITSLEQLEELMDGLPDESKASLRSTYAGESTYVEPTQAEKDKLKYLKRGEALPKILAEVATDNVGRVRAGTWTVSDLIALTQDAGVKEVLSDMMSLSFEIAYSKIDALTPSILTSDIKSTFKARLAANFFNT